MSKKFVGNQMDYLLLLDDLDARYVASQKGLRFTGLLGVLQRAKDEHMIAKVKLYIEKLRDTDFRLSEN